MDPLPPGEGIDRALEIARERGILPSDLSAREMREALARDVRDMSVSSARTTNAVYLQGLRDRLQRMMEGGYESDRGQLRVELRQLLRELGYTPEAGFPGDEELQIPPAEPGSLRDLTSARRLNLILDTEEALVRSQAQKQRGLDPVILENWPAWELVRVGSRNRERGTGSTTGWPRRWQQAGGELATGDRMIAHKQDAIWSRLGDPSLFDDALNTDRPPFAFNSGMGWRAISRRELESLGIDLAPAAPDANEPPTEMPALPQQPLPAGLDVDFLRALQAAGEPRREELERIRRGET